VVEWKNGKLVVSYHEWAWSARTSGFGVYAIKSDGTIEKIGTTTKKPAVYHLPDSTIAVMRYYESNKGYVSLYIYTKDGKSYAIHETESFRMPYELDDKIKEAIIRWLNLG